MESKPAFHLMTRFAILGVGLLLFALIFLTSSIYVLGRADPSKLEPTLELGASYFLKRNLEIGELVELNIGRDTYLLAEDITLANPDWATGANFVSVQRLEVRFNIPSAWQDGPLLIDFLKLTKVKLDLLNPVDHPPNWDFYPEVEPDLTIQADKHDKDGLLPFLVKHGHIDRGEFSYKDPDQDVLVRVNSLDIEEPRQGDLLEIELDGSIDGIPMNAVGHLGPSAALITQKDLELALNLNWGQLEVKGQGTIGDVSNLSGLNLYLRVIAPGSRPLLDAMGMQEVRDGPLFLEGTIIESHPGITINVDGTLDDFDIHLSGRLKNPREVDGVDMTFTFGGPSLYEVGTMFELHGLPAKPYKISGAVTRNGSSLTLRKGLFTAGKGHLTVEGSLPNYPEIDDWQVTTEGAGVNLALVGPLIGVEDLPVVPYEFNGEFRSNEEGIELIKFHFNNSISEIKINGVVGQAPSYTGSSIQLDFSGTNLASTGLWLGLNDLPSEPFTLNGKLSLSEDGWQLTDTVFDMPAVKLNVSGEIEKLFEPSRLTAELQINTANLATMLAKYGFNIENIPESSVLLTGKISGTPADIEIKQATITSGNSSMSFSGMLGNPTQLSDIDLSVNLKTPDLLPFLPLPNKQENEKEQSKLPVEVDARVKLSSTKLVVENLKGQLGEADITLDGQFNLTEPFDNSHITFNASSDHLGKILAPWVNQEVADSPFNVSLDARYESGGIQVDRLDAEFGTTKLTGQINIDDLDKLENAKGTIHLSGPSSKSFTSLLGLYAGIPDSEYSINVNIGGSSGWLHLNPVSVNWGKSDYSGSISIKPGEIPTIRADLHSNFVHLPFLFPTREELERLEAANKSSGESFDESIISAQLTEKELSERVIPATPVKLRWIRTIQGSLKYKADEIYVRKDATASVAIDASIVDGVLSTRELSWDGPFTSGNIKLRINAQEAANVIEADVEMKRIPLVLLMGGKPDYEASAFYKGQLKTTGNSIREMAQNLNGAFVFKGGGGSIDNKGADLILGDALEEILTKLNPYSKSDTTSKMICHAGAMTIKNGKVNLVPGLVLRTKKIDVASAGTINLHTEKLNLAFSTRSRRGIGISASKAITPYFKIGGTLTHPRLIIDAKGAVVSGSAAAATAGLSIIAGGLWDRWIATAKNPCERMFTSASKKDRQTYEVLFD